MWVPSLDDVRESKKEEHDRARSTIEPPDGEAHIHLMLQPIGREPTYEPKSCESAAPECSQAANHAESREGGVKDLAEGFLIHARRRLRATSATEATVIRARKRLILSVAGVLAPSIGEEIELSALRPLRKRPYRACDRALAADSASARNRSRQTRLTCEKAAEHRSPILSA